MWGGKRGRQDVTLLGTCRGPQCQGAVEFLVGGPEGRQEGTPTASGSVLVREAKRVPWAELAGWGHVPSGASHGRRQDARLDGPMDRPALADSGYIRVGALPLGSVSPAWRVTPAELVGAKWPSDTTPLKSPLGAMQPKAAPDQRQLPSSPQWVLWLPQGPPHGSPFATWPGHPASPPFPCAAGADL